MTNTNTDQQYMRLAIQLAEKGCGKVSPNPMVGAVIVKDGKIIGQGYHEKYGEYHAERNALMNCTESPEGATVYVTLEPCCHHGKTPPCTDALIEAKVSKVVVGSFDPNPVVSGRGIEILRRNGIEVITDCLKKECDSLNEIFMHYITTNMPFVALKYAMSADGKIACHTGESRWITGVSARKHAHSLRNRYSAIMVGVGTVLEDDPLLTCRMVEGRNPLRVICDTNLRTPLTSQIVQTAAEVPTIIATCCIDGAKYRPYEEMGCQVWQLPLDDGHVDLTALMLRLGENKIDSVLIEGGGELNWSAIKNRLVQKTYVYMAPKLIGGTNAKAPVGGEGFAYPHQALNLVNGKITRLGPDFLIESEVIPGCSQE